MKILVLNSGSSSIKFQLFNMLDESILLRGMVEKIGEPSPRLTIERDGVATRSEIPAQDHDEALLQIHAVLESAGLPDAVGHRIVFGGETKENALLLTPAVERMIDDFGTMAPLHNPPALAGIRAAQKFFPGVPQAVAFDTSFHQTMPPSSYLYAIPHDYYVAHRIRRYGFHGISHRYVAGRAAELLGVSLTNFTGIVAHLGNGCSLTAIQDGQSIDTTMGMTPLEGIMMGARSGDIDPAIIFHLADRLGMSLPEIQHVLQKESGLKGVSGISNDLRDVESAADGGNERARIALEIYAYRIRKAIGAFIAALRRPRAVIFTGGVGENGIAMRERILSGLDHIGILFDAGKNRTARPPVAVLTAENSPVAVFVISTNEELVIARETQRLISS